ncbi:MAG: hypothetical protein LBP61_09890, partial [Desulfovibrio sp.]|nr:hypothetical protein [Desulfovibrio sp.]
HCRRFPLVERIRHFYLRISPIAGSFLHAAQHFIMGTGKYPVKDAGYMDSIRFGNSKKTLTRGAGLYMDYGRRKT